MNEPTQTIDWSKLPEWAQWVAMDYDGEWFAFFGRPIIHEGYSEWVKDKGQEDEPFCEFFFAQPHPGDWRDSLQQRPTQPEGGSDPSLPGECTCGKWPDIECPLHPSHPANHETPERRRRFIANTIGNFDTSSPSKPVTATPDRFKDCPITTAAIRPGRHCKADHLYIPADTGDILERRLLSTEAERDEAKKAHEETLLKAMFNLPAWLADIATIKTLTTALRESEAKRMEVEEARNCKETERQEAIQSARMYDAANRSLIKELNELKPLTGWWNCQCHGKTEFECECGSATAFVLYKNQLTAAQAQVKELEARLETELDKEQRRWQDRIDNIVCRYIEGGVDGSGCDSGDPLDMTATELELAFGKMLEEIQAAKPLCDAAVAYDVANSILIPEEREAAKVWQRQYDHAAGELRRQARSFAATSAGKETKP